MPGDTIPDPRKDPGLGGAVDLGNPLLIMARRFLEQCAVVNVKALFMVAQDAQGRIMLVGDAPGGPVHGLGLMAAASLIIGSQIGATAAPRNVVSQETP